MNRPRLLAAVVAWVVVVAVGSTVVWAVISRAGGQVVSADREVPAASGASDRHPSTRSSRPSSPSPSSSDAEPSSAGSATVPAPPQRRTWQGQAGLLVAECAGPAISLVSTQPNVGFHAELKKPGPEELEVEFDGNEDESGTTVVVTAACSGGVPVFGGHEETEGQDD